MEARLREIAAGFLRGPDARCFLGWEAAAGGTRPAVLDDPERVDRLVRTRACHANLTTHLPRLSGGEGRVGVAVKGCDARALAELVRARQVERDRLYVVGVPCATGLLAPDGESPAARCHGCRYPEGFEYDATCGPMETPDLPAAPDIELSGLGPAERRRFWEAELSRCIRCEACRKVCYACFCPECIFEASQPRWLSRREGFPERVFFHAVRALHVAGRCIGCDECARACPAGVRLDLLNRALRDHQDEVLGFPGAGLSDEAPPLQAFSRDDPEPGGGS